MLLAGAATEVMTLPDGDPNWVMREQMDGTQRNNPNER